MGQKVNPHGLRVGVINGWDSRWFAKDELVGDLLVEDHKIREYLKTNLYQAGIPKIEIERDSAKVRIFIHCAKPGMIVGKGGAEIEKLQETVSKMIGKQTVKVLTESDSRGANRSTTQNYNVIERDLMTPDEVGRLPRDESIVLISGTYPLKGAKYRIEEHPSYPEVDPGHAGARHEERFDFKEYRERRGGDGPMR